MITSQRNDAKKVGALKKAGTKVPAFWYFWVVGKGSVSTLHHYPGSLGKPGIAGGGIDSDVPVILVADNLALRNHAAA